MEVEQANLERLWVNVDELPGFDATGLFVGIAMEVDGMDVVEWDDNLCTGVDLDGATWLSSNTTKVGTRVPVAPRAWWVPTADVLIDLAHDETVDRVLRWVADVVGLETFGHVPRFMWNPSVDCWVLGHLTFGRLGVADYVVADLHDNEGGIATYRMPDGTFYSWRLALAAIAKSVGREAGAIPEGVAEALIGWDAFAGKAP